MGCGRREMDTRKLLNSQHFMIETLKSTYFTFRSKEFFRYCITGLASNGVLYAIYIALTTVGIGPKTSMSLVFLLGILQTFVVNRNWSFQHHGKASTSLAKYATVYISAYLINLAALWIAVDKLGFPHEIVQLFMIFACAVYIFLMLRFWVFRKSASDTP